MPLFSWQGIDLFGRTQKGIIEASSVEALTNYLLHKDIALLVAKQKKTTSFFNPIRTSLKVQLFRQLATLLDAGVYLDDALVIIEQQTHHKAFKKILKSCIHDVVSGLPLHSAFEKYSDIFDTITIQLIAAGQYGANFAQAFTLLADYQERRDQFSNQLRSAAFLPFITLTFFLVICSVIFVAIVPMFTSIFASLGQSLPPSTQRLQTISNFLTIKNLLVFSVICGLMVFIIKKMLAKTNTQRFFNVFVFKVPIVGRLLLCSTMSYFLQAFGLLLHGGVPIINALERARETVDNSYLKEVFQQIMNEVDKGKSLSSVMQRYPIVFSSDVIALIRVGEESATLTIMIDKAMEVYRAQVNRRLHTLTTVFQPLLMIVLGFLVMALILSVYIPIFDLSYVVH